MPEMLKVFEEANDLGLDVLEKLMGSKSESHTRFEGKALSPAVLASAKALIFLTSVHGGLLVGGLHATGFMITHAPTGAWSAPCFVTLNRIELGAVFGVETTHILMASATRHEVQELASGEKHQTFGSDITFQLWPFSSSESGPDDFASVDVNSGWMIAAAGKGLLFDFSLSGSSLAVDESKNKHVYGDSYVGNDLTGDIVHGKVPQPGEMAPLYRKINEIASRALA